VPTVFCAEKVVTMDGPVIEQGAVAIAGDRIVAVGSQRELQLLGGEMIDLGDVVLLPGLINSHCHLDYTILVGRLPPQPSFADWIRQINNARRELTAEDYLESIRAGISETRRWGTTSVANVESAPEILSQLRNPSVRIWWFAELIDVQPRGTSHELVQNAISFFQGKDDWLGGFGLSPHAPYTVSPGLLREAVDVARRDDLRLTMHLAESGEEMEMFREGRGRLFDLLQGLGRRMEDCHQNKTPLGLILDRETLDDRWIVVHLNELSETDFERLAQNPRFHIAHCPRSARYFQHRPFALRRLLDLGFNICLGTDSQASNSSLSLFAEMQMMQRTYSWLAPEQVLRMATVNGARALGQKDSLGKIREGFYADLIAIPIRRTAEIYQQVIDYDQEVPWMMLAGQILESR
jgi:cytosine/adenosine deaminase-related metal-dependent hydrolase